MQKSGFKKLKLFGIVFAALIFALEINAQPTEKLSKADSLFQAKRYTQSLELYRGILEENYSSPAMLLKMAYISEGLERPAYALFYLNLYQLKTSDEAVSVKMENMAKDNGFSGYTAGTEDFLRSLFYRFRDQLILLVAAFAVFSISVAIYQKRKHQVRPVFPVLLAVFFIVGLFYLVNFTTVSSFGIIGDPASPVMAGPSSASDLLATSRAGHKVRIMNRGDVWVKILWNDRVAYIKRNHLRSFEEYL